jgi:pantoate--beta-alanine ligase
MREAVSAIEAGGPVAPALAALERELLAGGFASVDYAALSDPGTLQPLTVVEAGGARLLVAARIGRARLIDNMAVAASV